MRMVKTMNVTIAEYGLGDMRIRLTGNEAGTAGIEIVPEGKQFTDIPFSAESCVQVHIDGDGICEGFGNGHTMRNSESSKSLVCAAHKYYREKDRKGLMLRLERQSGQHAEVDVSLADGESAFRIKTVYFNDSDEDIYIEMLSSFSVNGIIPAKAQSFTGSAANGAPKDGCLRKRLRTCSLNRHGQNTA